MDSYHERLLKRNHMNQYQFNEAYKAKHIFTKFSPTLPVDSIFVQAARLTEQHQSAENQHDANNGSTFGTQEESHQPQPVTFNEHLVNVPTFETEYQYFAPLKRAM